MLGKFIYSLLLLPKDNLSLISLFYSSLYAMTNVFASLLLLLFTLIIKSRIYIHSSLTLIISIFRTLAYLTYNHIEFLNFNSTF